MEKVQGLIDKFYTKPVPTEHANIRVSIEFFYREPGHYPWIHDVPTLWVMSLQGIEDSSEEESKLIAAHRRKEMDRFARFLKEKFFKNERSE